MASKAKGKGKWMQKAFSKNKGKLHRELGVPEGETIPASKLESAIAKGGTVGHEAQAAKNAGAISRKRSKKKGKK